MVKVILLECQRPFTVVVMIVWQLDLQLSMQSVSITTSCEFESHPGEVYSIYYVIKVVIDLRQVDGFLRVLRIPPAIQLTAKIYLKSC